MYQFLSILIKAKVYIIVNHESDFGNFSSIYGTSISQLQPHDLTHSWVWVRCEWRYEYKRPCSADSKSLQFCDTNAAINHLSLSYQDRATAMASKIINQLFKSDKPSSIINSLQFKDTEPTMQEMVSMLYF